jgi:hypothetical protein
MRLTPLQTTEIEKEYGMVPIPPDSPAVPMLNRHFGDHTFFVDESGLKIWDWDDDAPEDHAAVLVQIAEWSDDDQKTLLPHAPKRLDTVTTLPMSDDC